MTTTIVVPERFRGPPKSGHGGYVCGLFGGLLTEGRFDLSEQRAAEVTLRSPVPLDQPLATRVQEQALTVHHGETLIAEVQLTTLQLNVPEPPSFEQALAVREHSPSLYVGHHAWLGADRKGVHPICFCCGAELPADQGLHVYAAAVPGFSQVAAARQCPEVFADDDGLVPPEVVCAALDCPGQFAWLAENVRTGLLGRLTVRVERPVRAGERCVITGWTMGAEGRKHYAGTALFDEQRRLCGYAKAVWIGRAP